MIIKKGTNPKLSDIEERQDLLLDSIDLMIMAGGFRTNEIVGALSTLLAGTMAQRIIDAEVEEDAALSDVHEITTEIRKVTFLMLKEMRERRKG